MQGEFATCFRLVYCWAYYYNILKIEATCSSETSAYFQSTTSRYIPEDIIVHTENVLNIVAYEVLRTITTFYDVMP
jgi:hypothetical protein